MFRKIVTAVIIVPLAAVIVAFAVLWLLGRLAVLAGSRDFTMQGHQLEIQGICKNCSKS